MENSMSLKIRQLLFELNLNQTEFAKELGIKPQSVSAYLAGGGVSGEVLFKISEKFNVRLEWLNKDEMPIFNTEIVKETKSTVSIESKSFADKVIEKYEKEIEYYKQMVKDMTQERKDLIALMSKSQGNLVFA